MKDTKSMSTNNDDADEMPTTFQLAQLATMVQPQTLELPVCEDPDRVLRTHSDRCGLAMELWLAAAKVRRNYREADAQLAEMFRLLPSLSPEDWYARHDAYDGEILYLVRATYDRHYPTEEVSKELFKDKSLTRSTRAALVSALVDFGLRKAGGERVRKYVSHYEVRAVKLGAEKLKADLSRPSVAAWFVRWLVECRETQIADSKNRHGDAVDVAAKKKTGKAS